MSSSVRRNKNKNKNRILSFLQFISIQDHEIDVKFHTGHVCLGNSLPFQSQRLSAVDSACCFEILSGCRLNVANVACADCSIHIMNPVSAFISF